MPEYIKKETLIDILNCKSDMAVGTPKMVFASVIKMVDVLPAVDVMEIREARWKGAGLGDYYCSLCCTTYSGGDEYNYCPNCGAKMKDGDLNA